MKLIYIKNQSDQQTLMNRLEDIEAMDLSEDIEMEEDENGAQNEIFSFPNHTTCWVCNGYYAPNFGEPLCGTCHAFLYNTTQNDEIVTTMNSDSDEDSGNDEPPFKDKQEADDEDDNDAVDDDVGVGDEDEDDDNAGMLQQPQQERQQIHAAAYNENLAPAVQILDGEQQNMAEHENERFYRRLGILRPRPAAPLSLPRYMELLCDAQEGLPMHIERNGILALPVEIFVIIFSYLDDMSMWRASTVCKQWNNIIAQNTSQLMWKKYFKERWPLYQSIVEVPNWMKLYGALMSSCFCNTCLIQMASKTPTRALQDAIRTNSLRADFSLLTSIASEGIEAIPLDKEKSNWQASILGPAGSPYEGGKFFLFIFLPEGYPMNPPTVRFLTKILHPNVSRHGDVGIDIFQHNWSIALNVSKVLISVQSILTDPYTEVCMEPELGYMYEHNRSRFESLARAWTWKYAMFELMPPR